jgi:mRNA-degrading endonuclease toxin of MazEF toxin-antitoxin module
MTQWEIWTFRFGEAGEHPAVIVSHPDRVARAPLVNVLYCASQRASRSPEKHEALLDDADGLDWETLVRCDLLYLVEKSRLHHLRGLVRPERRRQLAQKIVASLGLNLV